MHDMHLKEISWIPVGKEKFLLSQRVVVTKDNWYIQTNKLESVPISPEKLMSLQQFVRLGYDLFGSAYKLGLQVI